MAESTWSEYALRRYKGINPFHPIIKHHVRIEKITL